jgi:hypothetical protein
MGASKPILMPHQMLDTFIHIGEATGNTEIQWTPFANLLRTAVEAVVASPSIALVRRGLGGLGGGTNRLVWGRDVGRRVEQPVR